MTKTLLFVVALLFILPISSKGQIHAGSIATGAGGALLSAAHSVSISGNYAYITSQGSNALEVVDISNPALPKHKSSIIHGEGGALLHGAWSVYISGNYAYVTSLASNSLEIIDISNPGAPFHKGSIVNGAGGALLSAPYSVFVSGNYAYVASKGSNALEIIDVSNPVAPQHTGSIINGAGGAKLLSPQSVFVSGNYAYVASQASYAVEIIDVSNPASPTHLSSITTGAGGVTFINPASVYVSGNYLYVASTWSYSLEIIDVTNPATPVNTGHIYSPGTPHSSPSSVFISGSYAYLTSYNTDALSIIDVSNPVNPLLAGSIANGSDGAQLYNARNVYVAGNKAYVAGGNTLEIVDVTDVSTPGHSGSISHGAESAKLGGAKSVFVSGNYAYVTSSTDNALEIVDVTIPASPIHKGNIAHGEGGALLLAPSAVAISGNYAYVTSSGSHALEVIDVSNPSAPTHVASLSNGAGGALLNTPNSISVSGDFAYIASWGSNAIEIVNISNPTAPTHAASFVDGTAGADLSGVQSICISGNLAYLTSNNSLYMVILDITNPTAPSLKNSVRLTHFPNSTGGISGYRHVHKSGNLAFITNYNGGMNIFDVSNPLSPVSKSIVYLAKPKSVFVSGSIAYITTQNPHQLYFLDLTEPMPISQSVYTMQGSIGGAQLIEPNGVHVVGNYAYVASIQSNALAIVKFEPITITSFSPTSGKAGSTVTIQGTNFNPVFSENTVKFHFDKTANVIDGTSTSLTATVPDGVWTGPIAVSKSGETQVAKSRAQFISIPTVKITSASSGTFGGTINLTTDKGGSSGTLTYNVTNITGSASINGSVLSLNGAGTVTLEANISSDGYYSAGSDTQTITINKASQAITFAPIPDNCINTSYSLDAASSSGLPITYSSSNSALAVISGNTVTRIAAGIVNVIASQSGNINYNPAVDIIQPLTVLPNPTISVSPDAPSICQGSMVSLAANGGVTYSWSPSAGLSSNTGASVNASPSSTTIYSVTGTAFTGCSATQNVTITVNSNPSPTISGGTVVCTSSPTLTASSASSYLWSTGATTQSITAPGGGNYTVTVTNQYGCSATSSPFTVTDNRPSATMIPTAVFNTCSPTGTLVASPGTAYQWYRNGVATTNTTQNFNVTQGGSYYVAVTNPAGCSGVTLSTGQYIIQDQFSLTAANKTTCAGNGVALTGTPTGGTWSGPGVSGSTFYSATSGTFAVTYTYSSGGCTQSTPAMITVNPGVVITSFEGTSAVCPGNSYTYRANVSGSGYTYTWTKPSGWTTQSQSGNQITFTVPSTNPNYGAVGVTVSKSGCSASDGVTVYPGSCGSGSFSYSYSVSPNPANNELTLTTEEASEQPTPIIMYDQFGKTIKTVVLKPGEQIKTIETSELSSGFYWIQIGTKGKPVQKKVIVLHEK